MKRLHFATYAGALLLSVGCGQKNNAKPTDKPIDKPVATPATTPAPKPASTAVVPTPETPTCRALVNLSSPDGPGVADVKISATATMDFGSGAYVMVDNGQTTAVQVASFSATDSDKFGSLKREWDEIAVTTLPGGTAKIVTKSEPEVVLPDADSATNEFTEERGYSIESLIGPFLSVSVPDGGFTGGVHEYNDTHELTLKMPEAQEFALDILKTEAMADITAVLKTANEERKKEVEDAEELTPPDSFKQWALSFQSEAGSGLRAKHILSCCSWAENHNMFDLDVPLSKVPSFLQSYLKLSADQKWIEAPDGCGGVSLEKGTLKVRAGKDGAAQDLKKEGVVMGVYWVDAKSTFAVSQLPKPIAKVDKSSVAPK